MVSVLIKSASCSLIEKAHSHARTASRASSLGDTLQDTSGDVRGPIQSVKVEREVCAVYEDSLSIDGSKRRNSDDGCKSELHFECNRGLRVLNVVDIRERERVSDRIKRRRVGNEWIAYMAIVLAYIPTILYLIYPVQSHLVTPQMRSQNGKRGWMGLIPITATA